MTDTEALDEMVKVYNHSSLNLKEVELRVFNILRQVRILAY